MTLEAGQTVGAYRIGAFLGEGPLAVTWRAVHLENSTDHAIKVVFNRDPAVQERIRRAADAQQRLNHPNLVRVDEVLDVQGAVAIVTELVPDGSVESWLAERRPLDEVLLVWRDVALGVQAAHDEGLVHRNLKPAKILLDLSAHRPQAKVNDFTLVKITEGGGGRQLTQMGVSFGTPQYMAPEQFRDVSSVDARADLFALGAILYELTTGRRAFDGTDLIAIYKLSSAADYTPPRELAPDLPDAVVQAIDHMLRPDPAERPPTVQAVIRSVFDDPEVIERVAALDVEPAPDEPEPIEPLKAPGRSGALLIAVGALLLFGMLGALLAGAAVLWVLLT